MKKINWILVATFSLLAMAFVSCNKDITLQEIEQESAGTISVSVDGIMGEYAQGNETKAGLVSTTRVSWSAGDKVYVYDGASCLGELTVSLKDGKDYYAVLTGDDINAPQTGTTKLTLVYSNATVSEISDGKVSVDISAQEGNTSPKDIPFVAIATLDYTSGTPEISGQIADFSLATSLMRLNCSGLAANAAITGATLTGMSNECVLNVTKDGATIGQGNMDDISVSFTGVSTNDKGAQTLYAAVAKNVEAIDQSLLIYQNDKYEYSFGSKTRDAGKAFNAICQLVEKWSLPAGALPGVFSVWDGVAGHPMFRIHFSQGNLWYGKVGEAQTATFNFETNQTDAPYNGDWNPDHISNFYWSKSAGEAIKSNYDWDQPRSANDVFFTNATQITAKSDFTVNGVTGKYRNLCTAEWFYLLNTRAASTVCGTENARYAKATINGEAGIILIPDAYEHPAGIADLKNINNGMAPYTGNEYYLFAWAAMEAAGCVFLPTAGVREGASIHSVEGGCLYWSSSPDTDDGAFVERINSETVQPTYPQWRSIGYPVRLITESRQ